MRKLIIQIPCFNEETTLPTTLRDLPRIVPGYDVVEWLVINDGSADQTTTVARACGVDHVLVLPRNQGLARAFLAGIRRSLELGADTIVNTDADNQYRADYIPALVRPILEGRSEIVVGHRPIKSVEAFSPTKKRLQVLGSWAVSVASGATIPDAPSGFRAFNREAAIALVVFNSFTYTLETLIQAGRGNFRIVSVPIEVNRPTRPSRLFKSNFAYVARSLGTIIRVFITYKPLRFFTALAAMCFVPGILIGLRFLLLYFTGNGMGNIQSLILAAILIVAAVVFLVAGVLADLVATNRVLLEDIRIRAFSRDLRDAAANERKPAASLSMPKMATRVAEDASFSASGLGL